MILEKVYDELYGMIEDLKKKIQAAEKSDVTITPALESGTKIADFEIDGTEGSIYAPTQVNADWNATEGAAEILNKPAPYVWTLEDEFINGDGLTGCIATSYIRVYSTMDRQFFRADFLLTTSADVAANSPSAALATIPAELRPTNDSSSACVNIIGGKFYPGLLSVEAATGDFKLVNLYNAGSRFYTSGSVFWAKNKVTANQNTRKTTKKK